MACRRTCEPLVVLGGALATLGVFVILGSIQKQRDLAHQGFTLDERRAASLDRFGAAVNAWEVERLALGSVTATVYVSDELLASMTINMTVAESRETLHDTAHDVQHWRPLVLHGALHSSKFISHSWPDMPWRPTLRVELAQDVRRATLTVPPIDFTRTIHSRTSGWKQCPTLIRIPTDRLYESHPLASGCSIT